MKSSILLFCVLSAFASLAQGQPFGPLVPNPMIAGLQASCVDATGTTVYTTSDPAINDIAKSTIALPGQFPFPPGTRLIIINPQLFGQANPLLQLFFYAHECGHHVSGDIVSGILLNEVHYNMELNADRIGIRMMRDELHINPVQAQLIASIFIKNPPMFPFYMAGPDRAQWILNCYNTHDDACTH